MAKQVVEELTRQHVPAECLPLDEYDVTQLPHERCVVFVASTTGEGVVPDNMRSFWRFLLRKDLPPGSLSAMRHACFGLGDSSYPKFNFAAKRLHRRLLQLGSTALLELGLADDQDDLGIDQALAPWLAALRSPRVAFWRVMALANGGVPVHVPDYMTIWHALFALAVAAMLLDWVLPVVWHAVTCRYCRSGTRRSSGQGRRSAPAAAVRSGTSTTPSAMGGGHGERRGVGLTGEQATNGHQNGGSSPADELRRVRLLQQAAYDEKVAKEARRRPASRRSRTRR